MQIIRRPHFRIKPATEAFLAHQELPNVTVTCLQIEKNARQAKHKYIIKESVLAKIWTPLGTMYDNHLYNSRQLIVCFVQLISGRLA